jgi:hypothetical protein
MTDYLTEIMASRTLVYICWVVAFALGIITCSIGGGIRDMIRARRFERDEYEAEPDATRILNGLYPERDDTVNNEQYFQATTDGKGFRLNERWREIVNETKPRSPEYMAQERYQREARPQDVTRIRAGQRPEQTARWPEWNEQERTVPGRHRQDGSALSALRMPTKEWSALSNKELVNA